MRTLQGWILLAVCSLLALPLAAQRTVTFTSAGGNASGYLALPATPGPHAAVILIQEWFGVNAWLKQQADTLAAQATSPSPPTSITATSPRIHRKRWRWCAALTAPAGSPT